MKKFITLLLAILLIVPVQSIFATTPQDGIYQGKGSGIGGDVVVSVTVVNGQIDAIEIESHNETPGLSDPAFKEIPERIIAKQSLEVDNITGATITADAIKEAVGNALSMAAGISLEEEEVTLPS